MFLTMLENFAGLWLIVLHFLGWYGLYWYFWGRYKCLNCKTKLKWGGGTNWHCNACKFTIQRKW